MFGRHVTDSLAAYCQGQLDARSAKRVDAHLAACAQCRTALEEVRAGIAATSRMELHEAPEGLWAKVEAGLTVTPDARQQPEVSGVSWLFVKGSSKQQRFNNFVVAMIVIGLVAIAYPRLRRAGSGDPNRPGWFVETIAGAPQIEGSRMKVTDKLPVGDLLETDSSSRARIKIADIGHAEIDPNSRLRLVKTGKDAHRMSLELGRISAEVSAPPRLFQVSTPSTLAVDLGCAYTLEVDANGVSKLHVTKGWVSLESGPLDPTQPPGKIGSYVPADALCETRKGQAPGVPVFSDAPDALKQAVAQLNSGSNTLEPSVRTILPLARLRDTLTLWHLLQRTDGHLRQEVLDRMLKLASLPSDATRQQAINLEPALMDRWRKLLEFDW